MTALSTLVPSLKRELAVPGTFDDVFPDTLDTDLIGALADGFGEAQMWGFFPTLTLTPNGSDWETSEPLSAAGSTLVVLFAASRILRSQIRNLNTTERYKAGPAEMELGRSAGVLKDELDYITDRLAALITEAKTSSRASLAVVHDNYFARGGGVTGTYGGPTTGTYVYYDYEWH
jgi:hypothetical protein